MCDPVRCGTIGYFDAVRFTFMALVTFGLSHHTAPLSVRERLAFTDAEIPDALARLRALPGIGEAALLSTCNRTEITAIVAPEEESRLLHWWQREQGSDMTCLRDSVYVHRDLASVQHNLRVASGLDSMVIGEPQILGQLKNCYSQAQQVNALGPVLTRLFQHAFAVAKVVRSQTRIGENPVTIAYAAAQLAQHIFSDFRSQTALLIGAGETSTLLARHLRKRDIGRLIVANRSLEKAQKLALELGGLAVGLNDLAAHLPDADLVIASTGSREHLLQRPLVEQATGRRRRKPVLMIDLAVPRNIDPAVGNLEDVYLYGLDDLREVIAENLKAREAAAEQAEELIESYAQEFMHWLDSRSAADTIRRMRVRARSHRDEVLARARRRLAAGTPPEEVLVYLADALNNRLMHAPSRVLRNADAVEQSLLLSAASRLFDLPEEDTTSEDDPT